MRLNIVLLLFCIYSILFGCVANNIFSEGSVYKSDGITVHIVNDMPVTGVVRYYWDWSFGQYADNLSVEYEYKDGKRHGICKMFYVTGELMSKFIFKDGKLEGVSTGYYESGALESITHFKNHKQDGIEEWYFESGALSYKAIYKDDILLFQKCWDEFGAVIACIPI